VSNVAGTRRAQRRPTAETELYGPVKAFFEAQGFVVKGEVRGCDLVAWKGEEPPVIVELKTRFTLALVLQGVDRLALSARVYLAVPKGELRRPRRVRKLCRRLGLGLIGIGARGAVAIVEEPGPYRPRIAAARVLRLTQEFARRAGDPNVGGGRGVPLVTAYRQDALRCARTLATAGPMRLAALRAGSGVPEAARLLQRNPYGWFARIARGTYGLTEEGRQALARFAEVAAAL
jgi:hypothetical protein